MYYHNDLLCESLRERQLQMEGYRRLLGVHPSTAKSLHYLGLTHLKSGFFQDAQICCLVSQQMYQRLYGAGIETMTVFSDYGMILFEHKKTKLGIRYLEKALRDVENISQETERVPLCVEKLAAAKQALSKDVAEVENFKNKAGEFQERGLYKTKVWRSPKFHLLVKENRSFFEGMDNIERNLFKLLLLVTGIFTIIISIIVVCILHNICRKSLVENL